MNGIGAGPHRRTSPPAGRVQVRCPVRVGGGLTTRCGGDDRRLRRCPNGLDGVFAGRRERAADIEWSGRLYHRNPTVCPAGVRARSRLPSS
jgi:hypothetical protein